MNLPENLLYSEEHEWIEKLDDNKVRIGITEFAQDELGDIVFVELPEEDDEVEVGESFGSVESVKTVSELYSPVTGTVLEVNEDLDDEPEAVNESPYEKAWMVVVELSDASELEPILTSADYIDIIEG